MRYHQVLDNVWEQPVRKNYKMACCDCGLVHDVDFRIHKGKIQMRARRNGRSTGQLRRWNKKNN